jgi:hypothetical protein
LIPESLLQQYTIVRNWSREGRVYAILESNTGSRLFVKGREYRPHLSRIYDALCATASTGLVLPLSQTRSGNWVYLTFPYFSYGDFRHYLERVDPPNRQDLRALVTQVHRAITSLHALGAIHCDIKPSNLLLTDDPTYGLAVALCDFDQVVFAEDSLQRTRGRTLRYCAPELLSRSGTTITPAVDFWSLGMVLLEWLTGSAPFEGLSDDSVTTRLVTDWVPDTSSIESSEARALLGGLLHRDPNIRFDGNAVSRWLDGDIEIISRGLNFLGESTALTPFLIGNMQVLSRRGLGQALRQISRVAFHAYGSLPQWIETELRRADLARRVETSLSLQEEDEFLAELDYLQLCQDLTADSLCFWRGRLLDERSVCTNARHALDGDADALDWLRELNDERLLAALESRRDVARVQLISTMQQAWRECDAAWEAMERAGAPVAARPDFASEYPTIVLRCLDSNARQQLRELAQNYFQPALLLFRANWFFTFGVGVELPWHEVHVLSQLESQSMLESIYIDPVRNLDLLSSGTLSDSVILLSTQAPLLDALALPRRATISQFDNEGEFVVPRHQSQQYAAYARRTRYRSAGWRSLPFIQRLAERLRDSITPTTDFLFGRMLEADGSRSLPAEFYAAPLVSDDQNPFTSDDSIACMVRVSWATNHEAPVVLKVTKKWVFFLRRTVLRVIDLPSSGHLVLVVTDNANLGLRSRLRWFERIRSGLLRIRIDSSQETLRPIDRLPASLLKPRSAFPGVTTVPSLPGPPTQELINIRSKVINAAALPNPMDDIPKVQRIESKKTVTRLMALIAEAEAERAGSSS